MQSRSETVSILKHRYDIQQIQHTDMLREWLSYNTSLPQEQGSDTTLQCLWKLTHSREQRYSVGMPGCLTNSVSTHPVLFFVLSVKTAKEAEQPVLVYSHGSMDSDTIFSHSSLSNVTVFFLFPKHAISCWEAKGGMRTASHFL